MIAQKNTKIQKDHNLIGSCEMEDLTIYPYELVNREFFGFIEKTSFIKENYELLSKVGQNLRLNYKDWLSVDQAILLFQKNIQNAKKKSIKWSDFEKKLFYWIVMRYYIYNGIKDNKQLVTEQWREISKMVLGRNAHQCRLKWEQKYKIPLSEAPWTEQEDNLLYQVHEEFKKIGKENKWSQISREIYKRSNNKKFRQPKQCRERWINRLDPNISNDPWNKQQEIDLLKTILMRGKKWSELSSLYGRVRTENSLKNKYNSLLKREKMKYEFETINPHLFERVQKLRKDYAKRYGNITPIEEIDNYEWQFIVLAIQGLYIEQCIQEGKIEEAQKINNDDFFNLFHEDTSIKTNKSILYKKELTIQKLDPNLVLNNEKCGVVIFNNKNNKLYLTPYNVIDFQNIVLNQIKKKVKIEDNTTTSSTQSDPNQNYLRTSIGTQSIQQLLYLTNQHSYYVPINQSIFNSYWLPPVFPQQIVSSQVQNNNFISHQQQFQDDKLKENIELKKKEDLNDIFEQCGVDIKIVNSDDEK
ncbi:unnamed protein product [Paramecium sonneborni]|uniref:Myb-like DNA-binding domain protein n=1 Tax=Paramecium sonneborni TaxID=65129 RepID=A0A8S1P048_9CILI|nr:unnamed protein product [Paramecium sonneborni]